LLRFCYPPSSVNGKSSTLAWRWFCRGAGLSGATVEHLVQFGNALVKVSLSDREPLDSRVDNLFIQLLGHVRNEPPFTILTQI
jgi:hypothetical protein